MATEYHIVLAIITKDKSKIPRVMENMQVMATGWVAEDCSVNIGMHAYEEEEHS